MSDTWERKAVLDPFPYTCGMMTTVRFGRKIYLFGGENSNLVALKLCGDLWSYDIDTCVWRPIAPIGDVPSPRRSHSVALDEKNGKMYILYGLEKDDVFEFDLILHQWKRLRFHDDNDLQECYGHSSVFYNNKIFVFGGISSQHECEPCDQMYCLDLRDMTCQQIKLHGDIPDSHFRHCAALIQSKMLVKGRDAYIFEIDLETKQSVQKDSVGRSNLTGYDICVTNNGTFLYGNMELWKIQPAQYLPLQNAPFESSYCGLSYDDVNRELVVFPGSILDEVYSLRIGPRRDSCAADFLAWFVAGQDADLDLVCANGECVSVHSVIISARFPLFPQITPRMSADVVRVIARFLYTGNISCDLDLISVVHVAVACEGRKELERLQVLCEARIVDNVSPENCQSNLIEAVPFNSSIRLMISRYYAIRKTQRYIEGFHRELIARISNPPKCTLREDLLAFMTGAQSGDFSVTVGEEKFWCHLAILNARCSFFQQCMGSGMLESKMGSLDYTQSAIKLVLRFIYGGESALEDLDSTLARDILTLDLTGYFGLRDDLLAERCKQLIGYVSCGYDHLLIC